jgi:hypothetical protein
MVKTILFKFSICLFLGDALAGNGGNMKSWAFWNTNLSIYHTAYLMLKYSYLVLSAQFFILRVGGMLFL